MSDCFEQPNYINVRHTLSFPIHMPVHPARQVHLWLGPGNASHPTGRAYWMARRHTFDPSHIHRALNNPFRLRLTSASHCVLELYSGPKNIMKVPQAFWATQSFPVRLAADHSQHQALLGYHSFLILLSTFWATQSSRSACG